MQQSNDPPIDWIMTFVIFFSIRELIIPVFGLVWLISSFVKRLAYTASNFTTTLPLVNSLSNGSDVLTGSPVTRNRTITPASPTTFVADPIPLSLVAVCAAAVIALVASVHITCCFIASRKRAVMAHKRSKVARRRLPFHSCAPPDAASVITQALERRVRRIHSPPPPAYRTVRPDTRPKAPHKTRMAHHSPFSTVTPRYSSLPIKHVQVCKTASIRRTPVRSFHPQSHTRISSGDKSLFGCSVRFPSLAQREEAKDKEVMALKSTVSVARRAWDAWAIPPVNEVGVPESSVRCEETEGKGPPAPERSLSHAVRAWGAWELPSLGDIGVPDANMSPGPSCSELIVHQQDQEATTPIPNDYSNEVITLGQLARGSSRVSHSFPTSSPSFHNRTASVLSLSRCSKPRTAPINLSEACRAWDAWAIPLVNTIGFHEQPVRPEETEGIGVLAPEQSLSDALRAWGAWELPSLGDIGLVGNVDSMSQRCPV